MEADEVRTSAIVGLAVLSATAVYNLRPSWDVSLVVLIGIGIAVAVAVAYQRRNSPAVASSRGGIASIPDQPPPAAFQDTLGADP